MMLFAVALALGQAAPAGCQVEVSIPQGLAIPLVTVDALSSKTSAKGDLVKLSVAEDVRIGELLVIPKGTAAMGQIADSQQSGAVGVSGKLILRPLYLRLNDAVIRLIGQSGKKGPVPAGTVFGIAVLNGGIMLSGSTARIPAGSSISAMVERPTMARVESGAGSAC